MRSTKYQMRLSWDNSWHMDRPHFHEDIEILLCLSEGGDFFIENDTMAEYTLPPKIFISKDAKKASDHLPIYVDLDIKKRR